MNSQHKLLQRLPHLQRMRRSAESGYTITIQALYYTLLLFIFFALIYDFGNVGYVQSIGSNAVRMAAQDAAKSIDTNVFLDTQEIRLNGGAVGRAQDVVNGMTGGKVTINNVSVQSLQTRDVIVVEGTARAQMPILGSLFGLWSVDLPLKAYAEPAYGIQLEGQ